MIQNSLETFADNVFFFLTGETRGSKGLLVKKHSESVNIHGEFSFPLTVKSWHGLIDSSKLSVDESNNLMTCIGKTTEELIKESQNWNLQINKVKERKGRIHIFLDRIISIRTGMIEALKNNELITSRLDGTLNSVSCESLCNDNCMSSFRLRHFAETIQNLCAISGNTLKIFVSGKSSCICPDGSKMVLCGAVVNAKTGSKEKSITGDEFVRLRQNEMTLIAQHKYGVRVSTDSKWKEFIASLGESAAVFELLETKPSSAVKINFGSSSAGSSKGAAFVLYNCARLETIVRTFNEKVDEAVYPPLPEFENTDLTLLTQEDEWNIVFNFILGFPGTKKTPASSNVRQNTDAKGAKRNPQDMFTNIKY
ncbi:hypothetical protein MSG28_009523 [Choristoneura fumiferana]|uniref:Uncharacterized protein n=1 Tax=Choristoneura fumiferana TaxID=7141 RepID=A0ACC0JBJ9_CHOFU|nr:hypothetical protein MSG28_009523 [Choristoneura fumiferana]